MLSTAADVLQFAQTAPWVAVGVLALVAAAWVYRQGRRGLAELRAHVDGSAERQGKRLGDLEKSTGMLDLRRRQVEYALADAGLELPYWPADGAPHRRPRDVDEDQADELGPDTMQRRIPVPPLDPAVGRSHRRT
jgi:hypothetical protein